jgi:hypothetical protein
MLVCNVSLRAPRRTIAAALAETATADDASTTGQLVLATLVDDPGNALDTVDSYSGEIMLEAATAADTVVGAIPYTANVAETTTATDTSTATTAAPSTVTWNPSDKTSANLVLSNGNLSAGSTVTGTEAARATSGIAQNTKVYFEVTFGTLSGGNNTGCGLIPLSSSLSSWCSNGTGGLIIVAFGPGNIYVGPGGYTGETLGSFANATVGCAVDMVNKRFWARINNGNWNNNPLHDPVANNGGIDLSGYFSNVLTTHAYPAVSMNEVRNPCATVNFGPSFAFTPPSGYGYI